MDWHNEEEVYRWDTEKTALSSLPFPGAPLGMGLGLAGRQHHSADAPVMTFAHYNMAAYTHIRRNKLYEKRTLEVLRTEGNPDPQVPRMKTIPVFPRDAKIIMTAWWPVASDRATALPVWDPDENESRSGGNDFTSWSRIVLVDPQGRESAVKKHAWFAGAKFSNVQLIPQNRFHSIAVTQIQARLLMQDPGSRKAAIIALGRTLKAGDNLVLVGFHVVSFKTRAGLWGTFWWHDKPNRGEFAIGKPAMLSGPWRNYLMDVAFDETSPREADGSPNICFNPWFEARFPDGGHGNGLTSNCISCHARAGYPRTDFLPVTRGAAAFHNDPAFSAGRLRTQSLWSLANPAEQ